MKLIFKGLRRQLGEVPCLVKVANQRKGRCMLQRRDPAERRAAGLDKGARPAAWSCPMAALVAAARALCQDFVHALLHRRVKATNELGHAMAAIS